MSDGRDREIAVAVAHRPWPLPSDPWVMAQGWQDLLFAHWPVPVDVLRPLVPAPLELEEAAGSAWVGLTPFRLTGLRARFLPPVPGISDFPEMNLRTYVRFQGRPGVFFFSLDAGNRAAVLAARLGYRLPYFRAEMAVAVEGDPRGAGEGVGDGGEAAGGGPSGRGRRIRYRSRRRGGQAEFVGSYGPEGPAFAPRPGTLEHFLTERYALYVVLRSGGVLRGDIHHRPWSLQPAGARIERNTVAAAHGIPLPDTPPRLHFAARQDTLVWAPKLVTARTFARGRARAGWAAGGGPSALRSSG